MEPITPEQAAKNLSKTQLDHHIREINGMLRNGGRTYATSLIGDRALADAICAAFRAKGWRVSIVTDWRDGDFLQFGDGR